MYMYLSMCNIILKIVKSDDIVSWLKKDGRGGLE